MKEPIECRACHGCGKVFQPENRKVRYCAECRKLSNGMRDKMKHERERELAEIEAAALRKKPRHAFDVSCKGLKRIDAECKLFGISYGKYVAACKAGTIEQLLKSMGFNDPKRMLKRIEVETWK